MKVAVHLRGTNNKTNVRSEALAEALSAVGQHVVYSDSKTPVKGSELVIQTGFARSIPLMDAIERGVPYIIMEAPYFRGFYDIDKASSWGYNGLAGGSWRPTPPEEERPKPVLKTLRTEGKTLIVGQKPTDHSLRGSDHVQWLLDRFAELPEADFRPHPLMVPKGTLRPINEVIGDYWKVVTYTSTVGLDALFAGCEVRADHRGSLCFRPVPRDEQSHVLSWAQGLHNNFDALVPSILQGYDEARQRIRSGQYETPREKVDGPSVCERYYRLIVR